LTFSPEVAEKRFGYGLSPVVPPVSSVEAMLAGLKAADDMQAQYPIPGFDHLRKLMVLKRGYDQKAKTAKGAEQKNKFRKFGKVLNRDLRLERTRWFAQTQLRRINSSQSFRERLVAFWGDHFAAQGKAGLLRRGTSPYLEDAVRPQIAGSFADLLIACVTHPLMLHYLDQDQSVGPGSELGQQKGKNRGLNENLAREVLELHTLGVGGPYTQKDVQELAELFTGMTFRREKGFTFRKAMAEPGPETVLGETYGGQLNMGPIRDVLHDLAAHPATAAHIARKLAVHFIADDPPVDLVAHIETAYRDSGGNLTAVYGALLEHPAAWSAEATNAKPPLDFISSALRALAVHAGAFSPLKEKQTAELFYRPLTLMGQIWEQPNGPDGWPEADSAWITPQGVAARLEWAVQVPQRLLSDLPDPRDFVHHALGASVPPEVAFAASAAESRNEAIGLVLASPAFQRR